MPALTLSGNEVTDLARRIGYSLGTSASGQMLDGQSLPGGIGIRRAATNLFRRGQCDALTDWGSWSGAALSLDASISPPFGPQAVKVVTPGAVVNEGVSGATAAGQAAVAATLGVGLIYVEADPGVQIDVWMRWQNADATVNEGVKATVVGTGRFVAVAPPAAAVGAGKTGDVLYIFARTKTAIATTFRVAHAMLEKGQSVVAPYVATSGGATATHAAGRVQAPASLIGATQGWIAMRVRLGWASGTYDVGNNPTAFHSNLGSGDFVGVYRISGAWRCTRRIANVGNNADVLSAHAAGDVISIVAAWDANFVYLSINGSAFAKTANTTIPSLAPLFDIGRGFVQVEGDVLWFACGTGTITDTDAATIAALWDMRTQPNRRLMPWDFPPASLCQMTYDPRDNAAEFFRGAPGIPLIGGVS